MKKIKPSVGDREGIKIKKKNINKRRDSTGHQETKEPQNFHGHTPYMDITHLRETSVDTLPLERLP